MSNKNKLEEVLLLPSDADLKIDTSRDISGGSALPIMFHDGDRGMLDPGLRDPVEGEEADRWHPQSHRTRLLVACLLACKDICLIGATLDIANPRQARRSIALITTPLVSLCDNTKSLYDALGASSAERERASWPEADKTLYVETGRRLKKHRDGPIRKIRNMMGAHHNIDEMLKEQRAVPAPSLETVLPPLADSLLMLVFALNYRRVYTWRRHPHGAGPDEVEILTEYPIAMKFKLGPDGAIQFSTGTATIAVDPRHHADTIVRRAIAVYNQFAEMAQPPQRKITLTSREVADTSDDAQGGS